MQIFTFSNTSREKLLTSFKLDELTAKSLCSEIRARLLINQPKFNICSSFAIIITFKTDLLISFKMTFVPSSVAF